MDCPGCGKDVQRDDPMRTFAAISAHEILCRPPGFFDVMMAHKGHYTRAFAQWAGRSIETMARACA